jgi:dolichyl-phosphate-mannose-protein mannosyltransferase
MSFLEKTYNWVIRNVVTIYALTVLAFACITYIINYQYPNAPFWDESYHITSSEKYLRGRHFMEAHPPLGKLLIALGEKIVDPNAAYDDLNPLGRFCLANTNQTYKVSTTNSEGKTIETNQDIIKDEATGKTRPMTLLDIRKITREAPNKDPFVTTDLIGSDNNGDGKPDTSFPPYYSFCGVRLIPSIMAALSAPLFFLIIFSITRNPHLAIIFSSLYVFDNALLVHFRAAMLDGIQLFFLLSAFLVFVLAINRLSWNERQNKPISAKLWIYYGFLSFFLGLAMVTKHNAAAYLLLIPILWLRQVYLLLQRPKLVNIAFSYKEFKKIRSSFTGLLSSALLLVIAYVGVFYIHIAITPKVETRMSNNNNGLYGAGATYIRALEENTVASPLLLPSLFYNHFTFMDTYHARVPKLNYKTDDNGSYPANWPAMSRTISYRWDKNAEGKTAYLYLIGNPLIWFLGMLSMIMTFALIIAKLFYGLKPRNQRMFGFLSVIALIYAVYMGLMLRIIQIRVMYLYHYLIALILTLLMFPLLIAYLFDIHLQVKDNDGEPNARGIAIYAFCLLLLCAIAATFVFYSPFTYHSPLSEQEFNNRNLFDFWNMTRR